MQEFVFTPDRSSAEPLYRQLAHYIEELIDTGRLQPGERIPPTRELASALGVGRNTVALTYETLESSGRVFSHVGRGTFVSVELRSSARDAAAKTQSGEEGDRKDQHALAWSGLFAGRTKELIRLPRSGAGLRSFEFDFRGGRINPEGLPVFEIQKAWNKALQRHLRQEANHLDPLGYEPLRTEIARTLVGRGIRCEADDILITNGAQQGLDLSARALLDPGDGVVVERPGYFGAILAFRAAQASLFSVPVDGKGMRIENLFRLTRTRRIKMIYLTPAVQMPTGVTLSDPRRSALLDIADQEQIPILEDDYDGEFRADGPLIPALKTVDPAGLVIYVGTLTKVLFPGVRLGYVVAPRPLLDVMASVRFAANFQPSLLDQIAISEFMNSGDFSRHVRRVKKRHLANREALLDGLEALMPEAVTWNRPVAGSMVWIDLPAHISIEALARKVEPEGVSFYRGDLFGLGTAEPHGIALNFSSLTPERIEQGLGLLAKGIREISIGKHRSHHASSDQEKKRSEARRIQRNGRAPRSGRGEKS